MLSDSGKSSSSSPDPLADLSIQIPKHKSSPKRNVSLTPKKSLSDASRNRRLQDYYLTTPPAGSARHSPTRSIAQSENLVSPWRICVTVEAEKDEEMDNQVRASRSPSKRLTGRTITTIVPLKGLDDSSPAAPIRGRGRPRKSLGTPSQSKGTPKPKRKGTPGPKISAKLEDIRVNEQLQLDDMIPRKRPGRPRRSSVTEVKVPDNEQILSQSKADTHTNVDTLATGIANQRKRKGGGKIANEHNFSSGTPWSQDSNQISGLNVEQETVASSSQRRLDRRPTASDPSIPMHTDEPPVIGGVEDDPTRHELALSDPHASTETGRVEPDLGPQKRVKPRKSHSLVTDPTDKHDAYDSIMESEGFTMVSLASLPSAQQVSDADVFTYQPTRFKIPGKEIGSREKTRQEAHFTHAIVQKPAIKSLPQNYQDKTPKIFSSELQRKNDCASSHSQLSIPPGAHTAYQHAVGEEQTLSQMRRLSSLPPLSGPRSFAQSSHSINGAIEGRSPDYQPATVSEKDSNPSDPSDPSVKSSSDRKQSLRSTLLTRSSISSEKGLNDPFSGFGVETRRELRAGLRLGEELAKRQQLASKATAIGAELSNKIVHEELGFGDAKLPTPETQESYKLTAPNTQKEILYPSLPKSQLPSPERSEDNDDKMSWKPQTPTKLAREPTSNEGVYALSQNKLPTINGRPFTEMPIFQPDERMEAIFQLEREAVIKEIQAANKSQVVVIHGDDSETFHNGVPEREVDGEGTDIWQVEAQSSEISGIHSAAFQEQILKPRRSKLPSPWRRQGQVVYSDEVMPTDEDYVWQPESQHERSPSEVVVRKRASHEEPKYPILSDLVDEPDDECTRIFDTHQRQRNRLVGNASEPEDEVLDGNDLEASCWPKNEETEGTRSDLDDSDGSVADRQSVVEEVRKSPTYEISYSNQKKSRHSDRDTTEELMPQDINHHESCPQTVHELATASTSWSSRLSSFIPSFTFRSFLAYPFPVLAPVLPASPVGYSPKSPPASKYMSIYKPWTTAHYVKLRTLYLAAKVDPNLYPFNPESAAAPLLGLELHSMGWKKTTTEWELGVVDAFLDVLDTEGVDGGDGGDDDDDDDDMRGTDTDEETNRTTKQLIDEAEVMRHIFGLWAGEVQREETPLGNATAGLFDKRYARRKDAISKRVT